MAFFFKNFTITSLFVNVSENYYHGNIEALIFFWCSIRNLDAQPYYHGTFKTKALPRYLREILKEEKAIPQIA